jgi:hypothetical protein
MAFVNELISEADKARTDWSQFKWWKHSDPHCPWKWTIDRDRDAFLIPREPPGYDDTHTRPEVFALAWRGHIVRIEGYVSGSGPGKFREQMKWRIVKVIIPAALRVPESDVLQLIEDALKAHGSIFDTSHLKQVDVEFVARSAP